MGKAFFRFLRGELNGFYLTNINGVMNEITTDVKQFFVEFKQMQFNLLTMPSQTIYNIGTFAGVYLPRLSAGEAFGAMRMTESHIVNGTERSERGLLNRETEQFDFVHTAQDDYSDDINTLADSDNRSGLVGTETAQGYIASSEYNVIDDDGNVIPSAVSDTPPQDEAYSEFYGNEFMFLSEQTEQTKSINTALFIELYKVMQIIRYNGASIKSFANMVSILCPQGLVKIKSIEERNDMVAFTVTYVYDSSVQVSNVQDRIALLEYLTLLKFPQFMLVEDV